MLLCTSLGKDVTLGITQENIKTQTVSRSQRIKYMIKAGKCNYKGFTMFTVLHMNNLTDNSSSVKRRCVIVYRMIQFPLNHGN